MKDKSLVEKFKKINRKEEERRNLIFQKKIKMHEVLATYLQMQEASHATHSEVTNPTLLL